MPGATRHALRLQGEADAGANNYIFDVDGMLAKSRFTPKRAGFGEMLAESRVSIGDLHASTPGCLFGAWFTAFDKARLVVALLF
jgi:hypothetical protein